MTGQRTPAVGIDLGTTFSAIARLDGAGRPATLVNAEGDRITPSVVLFEGNEVVVGREALRALATEADHVAECAKRDVGYRVFHKVLEGKQYWPEVIEGWILNKLRVDAAAQIGPFDKVVITVPAYFDEVRRKATQDAGYIAGFEVLDIINEPTAAALCFGYQQGLLGDAQSQGPGQVARGSRASPPGFPAKPQRFLVYDLGGGTFDVTVMEIRGSQFAALATDGDYRLGGWDWDQRLVDLAAEAFIREHHLDPRDDPLAAGRLWRGCEEAKRTLSVRAKASIDCDHRGIAARTQVTRRQFEEATQDLLDRTRFTTGQTLQAAGLDWSQIDRVLLVGGSTRMPMVRQMLHELSGKEPDASLSADEAVAQGAAIHAGHILAKRGRRPTSFKIKNVNSHSLGVVGTDPATRRKRNGILIPRNTPLPVTAKRTFKTQKADQRSILVEIVEGESPSPEECSQLGRCSVRDLPANLPTATPIDVLFRYNEDGTLRVRVSVPGTGAEVTTELARANSIPKDHMDGWRRFISGAEPTDYR